MEYVGIDAIRNSYVDELIKDEQTEKALALNSKSYSDPFFEKMYVHPESEPNLNQLNGALSDIFVDLLAIRNESQSSGTLYKELMESVKTRLDAVDLQLLAEEERVKDINTICGNYKNFVTVKTLDFSLLNGSFSRHGNYTFSCAGTTQKVSPFIIDVSGNGYEGNKYVMSNNTFVANSMDTSNRNYMIDDSVITAYEYSRLTMNERESKYPVDANFDNEEATCSVTLGCENDFSTVNISSDMDTVIIKDVLISYDGGGTFESVMPQQSIAINNMDEKYTNANYIYGSGIISFPMTKCVKIVFQSNNVTSETIGFDWVDVSHSTSDNTVKVRTTLNSAKRHVIRINNIELTSGQYNSSGKITTDELVINNTPVKSIAIFANEYVPSFFPSSDVYFRYTLNVNGVDHKIVPLNSDREGTKVIRFLENASADAYVEHINESIKTAKLTIMLYTANTSYTPYLSNLKICFGEAETDK